MDGFNPEDGKYLYEQVSEGHITPEDVNSFSAIAGIVKSSRPEYFKSLAVPMVLFCALMAAEASILISGGVFALIAGANIKKVFEKTRNASRSIWNLPDDQVKGLLTGTDENPSLNELVDLIEEEVEDYEEKKEKGLLPPSPDANSLEQDKQTKEQQMFAEYYQPQHSSFVDALKSIAKEPQSTLFLGLPGAGKDTAIANCIRWFAEYHPHILIAGIDIKNDPGESEMWEAKLDPVTNKVVNNSAPYYAVKHGKGLMKPEVTCRDMYEFVMKLTEYADAGNPLLFCYTESVVLSEFINAGDKDGRKLKDAISLLSTHIISSGASFQQYFWVGSQASQQEVLIVNTNNRNQLRTVGIVKTFEEVSKINYSNPPMIPREATTKAIVETAIEDSKNLFQREGRPPIGRAVFIGGIGHNKWYPMSPLKIYGSNDRDKGQFHSSSQTRSELPLDIPSPDIVGGKVQVTTIDVDTITALNDKIPSPEVNELPKPSLAADKSHEVTIVQPDDSDKVWFQGFVSAIHLTIVNSDKPVSKTKLFDALPKEYRIYGSEKKKVTRQKFYELLDLMVSEGVLLVQQVKRGKSTFTYYSKP